MQKKILYVFAETSGAELERVRERARWQEVIAEEATGG